MQPKDALDIIAYLVGIGTTIVVVRSNVKKQTIEDLQTLVEAHEKTIKQLKSGNKYKDERISVLEETVDGYSQLVREGYLSGINRPSGRNRTAITKTTKNRGAQ